MPVYNDVQTMDYYPDPELKKREIFKDLKFESILDVGAGHGGVFDIAFWENDSNVKIREACDIHWIRPMSNLWTIKLGVDVTKLDEHYAENSFDYVQCIETLEHVPNSRLALEQLKKVAKKAVFITSADETHHEGPEQEAIEKINKFQAYVKQPAVQDLIDLGFEVRVEKQHKRQLVAWLIK